MPYRIQEQVIGVTAVKSEYHFFKVGRKVLSANPMPCSNNAALQKRESRLDRIGMNRAVEVNAVGVVDSVVFGAVDTSLHHGLGIANEVISDDHVNVLANVVLEELDKRLGFNVASLKEPEFPATLADADHDVLFGSPAAPVHLCGPGEDPRAGQATWSAISHASR